MLAIATPPLPSQVGFGVPGDRRLNRVSARARDIGMGGVSSADAAEWIESAIFGDGILPFERPSQMRAWSLALDRGMQAFYDGARAYARRVADAAVLEFDGANYPVLFTTAWHTGRCVSSDDDIVAAVRDALEAVGMPSDFGGASPMFPIRRARDAQSSSSTGELESFGILAAKIERADLALHRARHDAHVIFDGLGSVDFSAFVGEVYERNPALDAVAARAIATATVLQFGRPPIAQRCQMPGEDPFAETFVEPTEHDLERHNAAIVMAETENLNPSVQSRPGEEDGEGLSLAEATIALERKAQDVGEPEFAAALKRARFSMGRPEAEAPAPVDLWRRYEAPELPENCLPAVIEQFAISLGDIMGADPAGIAMSALAVCASAIPDDVKLQVKQHDTSWTECARLWVGLVGPPSTKKSPVMSAAMRPLQALDTILVSKNAAALASWERLEKKQRETTAKPTAMRRAVNDTTIEALQGILADSPQGVLSYQDELSGWFGALEKYSPGKAGAADRAFYLQAFNGGPYNVDRVMRGVVFVPNLSVGILGGIQPEPMRKLAADATDDGLIQRFLPVILRSATVGRDEPTGDILAVYDRLVTGLTRLHPPTGAGNLGGDVPLRFSAEALAIRAQLEIEHVDLVRGVEPVSPKLASHFGKHDGIFARLALLWHCIEHVDAPELPAIIEREVADRVARFMREYLRPSAIAFYSGVLGMAAGHEKLMALASVIVADRLTEVSARDAARLRRELRDIPADELRRICERLEGFGWLEPIEARVKGGAPRWRVFPAVHDAFAERGVEEAERNKAARAAFAAAFSGG